MSTITHKDLNHKFFSAKTEEENSDAFKNAILIGVLSTLIVGNKTINFVNKWSGLLGKMVVVITTLPITILFFQIVAIYFARIAKRLRTSKPNILKLVKAEDYINLKQDEEELNKFYKTFGGLKVKLEMLSKKEINFLFRRTYKSTDQIVADLLEIKNCIKDQYTISNSEFSKEDSEFLSTYWANYKKKNATAYSILAEDKSGEEAVFNIKKGK